MTPPRGKALWLLRHAKAVADPPPGGDDFDRELAPRGRRDAAALGHLIGRGGHEFNIGEPLPEVAFISPAARTVVTAELFLEAAGVSPRLEFPSDMYGGDPEDVLNHLGRLKNGIASALVVLHNPTGQSLARGLLDPVDQDSLDLIVRRGFPTCALVVYRLEVSSWADVSGQCGLLRGLFVPPFDGD